MSTIFLFLPSRDEDMRPSHRNIDHYVMLIRTLEKNLTPFSIKNFIDKRTVALPEASRLLSCVFKGKVFFWEEYASRCHLMSKVHITISLSFAKAEN